MKFQLLDSRHVDWNKLEAFEDRLVYQTREWMAFLADTQRATPVIAALQDGLATVGYFSGLIFRRAGIRILGSPFPGWTTPSMGFNLLPGIPRWQALQALERFAFQELKCLHLEVSDRYLCAEDGMRLGFSCTIYDCLQTNLAVPEAELFRKLSNHCRTNIRKGEKHGVLIEEAHDERFADDYYDQLKDVFAKQKLIPTFGRDRTRKLIHHLLPTGRLLLLRAYSYEGKCVATSIYVGAKDVVEYWGSASYRSMQHLKPNDLLQWYAIRYWRRRGMRLLSWGPRNAFKEKLAVEPISVAWFRKSRFAIMDNFRQCAKSMFDFRQRFLGNLHRNPTEPRQNVGAAKQRLEY
jgi:hypothetical protein